MNTSLILRLVEWLGLMVVMFNFLLAFMFSDTWGMDSEGFRTTLNIAALVVFVSFISRKVIDYKNKQKETTEEK